MTRFLFCIALAAFAAQAKPNFTGDWKLNVSKSDFGQMPAPSSMTMKNTHDEPSLKCSAKVSSDSGEFSYELTFKTDGTETVNQAGPSEMKSKAMWEGETLVMNTKAQFGDNEVTIVDKWELSEEGKTLTFRRHWSSSRGEMDQKMVLEKQ